MISTQVIVHKASQCCVQDERPLLVGQQLDVSPYMCKGEGTPKGISKYGLVGVVYHMGQLDSGHYTAMSKSNADDNMYLCDDLLVTDDPLCKEATNGSILFYRQGRT